MARWLVLVLWGSTMTLTGCRQPQVIEIASAGSPTVHYLPDYEALVDSTTGFATTNHLVVFNPGDQRATIRITIFFEDRDPAPFTLTVPAATSIESNASQWPVPANERFALMLESDQPVIAQATIGWTNTLNDYRLNARPPGGGQARETALSYLAHRARATRWMIADGLVLQTADLFIRESEWAVILNPSSDTARIVIAAGLGRWRQVRQTMVPPRRVRAIAMDSLVAHNTHYGAEVRSNVPIVVNWRRTVQWPDRPDLMAFWSVPMVGWNNVGSAVMPIPR